MSRFAMATKYVYQTAPWKQFEISDSCSQLVVKKKEGVIKSIEVQLIRVETCGCAEGFARECNFCFWSQMFFKKLVNVVGDTYNIASCRYRNSEHPNWRRKCSSWCESSDLHGVPENFFLSDSRHDELQNW